MAERFVVIEADGIAVTVDTRVGHVRAMTVEAEGRTLAPLHTAPWVDDETIGADEAIAPNLRWLSGDFFCAPFGASDVEAAPAHGWPANGVWRHLGTTREGNAVTAGFELEERVMGARLEKRFTLRDAHPFLYERHVFHGGRGRITVANHAMTRFGPSGGRLAVSPKAWGETPDTPLETDPARGRSSLAYPARFETLEAVPRADGRSADLTAYPIAERHEDFAMLVERPGNPLGWAAATRFDAADIVLSLKDPRQFPVTMLWFSNGGRDYAPWNGRHVDVLGIEEGMSYGPAGHRASIGDNPLSRAGIPTALDLEPSGRISRTNIVGAIPKPGGWETVAAIEAVEAGLQLTSPAGERLTAPCDIAFLTRED